MATAAPDYVSRLREATVMLQKMQQKLSALERSKTEPIAIVGIGCRFPGAANDPEAFWQLLRSGVDAVSEIGAARWPPGASSESHPGARWAGLLDAVDGFDAAFFGIAPREATTLDPQQRLLLEVAWEALENAGESPDRLAGSRTAVFVGISTTDYAQRVTSGPPESLDVYATTGNLCSTAAGRISYVLGLQGPCLSLDTGCSSSLVTAHLACQSLRAGESDLALAGGVHLMLSPLTMRLVVNTQALSRDGRCRTFDAAANGFVRAEGCGVVVLKRLSDAQRDGDRIWALIRGSAVNHDGHSAGLTVPNPLSQRALLQQALESARVSPAQVGYIEAHGTGTSLGDPIEVQALKEVFGAPRPDGSPCALGSVKTNVGHMEAAAGVGGLIKAALVVSRGVIPRHLHFQTLNPRISLDGTPLVVPVEEVAWRSGESPRIAGVSAFGMSGTNAHVVVEEPPPPAAAAPPARAHVVLPLSARSHEALVASARAYRSYLMDAPSGGAAMVVDDIAYTASVRRSHHAHRLAVVGSTREELSALLQPFSLGEDRAGLAAVAATPGEAPSVVFVFSGQGSQWAGMGRELLEESEVFRSTLEACDSLTRRFAGFSLLDVLSGAEASRRLQETAIAQPAIFALQVALSALLRSWGVAPDAVIGHSVGEIAAAHVAGALSLEEAVRLVSLRGRVMQPLAGRGKMVSAAMSPEQAAEAIRGVEDQVGIAAVNDPCSVVLSGEPAALLAVVERLKKASVPCRALRVDYAFHSPQMASLQHDLSSALGALTASRAALPIYSTATGAPASGDDLTAAYWARSIRSPVLFSKAVETAIGDGHRLFVELGPHPVLLSNLRECLSSGKADGHALPTLRRDEDARRGLLRALAELYAHGYDVDWKLQYPAGGSCVSAPTYPWQRRRYWIDIAGSGSSEPDRPPPPAATSQDAPRATERLLLRRLGAAPTSERSRVLERWLTQVVAETMKLDDPARLSPATELTGLGLDSLMSLEIRSRIEAALGSKPSVNWMLQHPTVASLTSHLLGTLVLDPLADENPGGRRARRSLVTLQPAGEGLPFFCVHPLGGPVLCYAELARHLGRDRPFHAFQGAGLEDDQPPDSTIEAMATRYVEAMVSVQPVGPYLLGGWSFGGLIAFEMAQQLIKGGEEVALLALMNGVFPVSSDEKYRELLFVELSRMIDPGKPYEELRAVHGDHALTKSLVEAVVGVAVSEFTESVRRLAEAHAQALWSYVPRPYPHRITYFRSTEMPPREEFGDVSEPYGTFYQPLSAVSSQPIDLHEVPGSHHSMVQEPHVRRLAERLNERIAKAVPQSGIIPAMATHRR